MIYPEVLELLKPVTDSGEVESVDQCGSTVTCDPPPSDSDIDYLVVVRNTETSVSGVVAFLIEKGFAWEGSEHYQSAAGNFMSWRKGKVNLIVTANPEFARRHRVATRLCAKLNLLRKEDRIALFQAVLYGADEQNPVPTPEDFACPA